MAVFPCQDFTPCFDPASPVANLSAEGSDGPEFVGVFFPWLDANNPIGGVDGGNAPPPTYFSQGCLSFCESTVSQDDANLCAQRQQFSCSHNPPNRHTPPPTLFLSNLQVCNLTCPDGSIFSYRLFAGAFMDTSQAGADEQAAAFACEVAPRFLICLSGLTGGCLGTPYSQTISNTGAQRNLIFSLLNGSLPDGLTFTQITPNSAAITGTPLVPGNFTFTVQASDNAGVVVQKVYSISIVGIINSPPQATQNSAYSFQFTAVGGTAPYTFFLASGSLPAGLTLASDGTISGTPTTTETDTFGVSVVDSSP